MKAFSPTDRIELAELSKLINRRKVADIRQYNMEIIEHAQKNGGSVKAVKRQLGLSKNHMYALRHNEVKITTSLDEIVKVAKSSTEIYTVAGTKRTITEEQSRAIRHPTINARESKKKPSTQCKAAGGDQVTADLLKDGGQVVLEKLATLYT